MSKIVIVGSSLAGLRAAEKLRTDGFAGAITMVSAESHAPYDRPPLSKKFLEGEWNIDRIQLRKSEDLASLGAEWKFGVSATAIDIDQRTITLSTSEHIDYDSCIIATGGAVRKLPAQPSAQGVHILRTVDDATALRDELLPGKRLVVVGAGFIGLEAAATATKRGCSVTVLEGLPAPLIRGLGEEMGNAVGRVHSANGVTIRCNVSVQEIVTATVTATNNGSQSHVTGVRIALADGTSETVPADVVLVGIGVAPATDWLSNSGLRIHDGIVCDENLEAAPGVFAAGDVARWVNPLFADLEPTMRVEHWTTAAEQGAHAARNALATLNDEALMPYSAVPFFWSDQFTARIQFLGRSTDAEEIRVVAGNTDDGKFAAAYMRAGRLVGVLGVSMPKVVMPARKLLETHTPWSEALAYFAGVSA